MSSRVSFCSFSSPVKESAHALFATKSLLYKNVLFFPYAGPLEGRVYSLGGVSAWGRWFWKRVWRQDHQIGFYQWSHLQKRRWASYLWSVCEPEHGILEASVCSAQYAHKQIRMIAPLQTGIVTFLAQHHHILDHEKWLCVYQMDSHTRMVASQGGSIVDDRPFSVADDFWHKHRGVGPILVDSSLKKINIPVRSVWKSVDIPHENMTAILPHITPCLRMSFMTPNPKVLQVFRLHRALKWVEKISILFLIVGSVFGVSLGIDCYTKRCLSSINISPPLRKTKYSPMRNKTHETLGQKLRKFHRNPHRKVFTHDF